jgi:hypothetical protein
MHAFRLTSHNVLSIVFVASDVRRYFGAYWKVEFILFHEKCLLRSAPCLQYNVQLHAKSIQVFVAVLMVKYFYSCGVRVVFQHMK